MTAEETRRRAQVMLAHADGAEVEYFNRADSRDIWKAVPHPSWDWVDCDYRIAEKPKEPRRASVTPGDCWDAAWPINQPEISFEGFERVEMIELTPAVIAALAAAGISYEDSPKPETVPEGMPDWFRPLPEGAVLLGFGGTFKTNGDLEGWCASENDPEWENGTSWGGAAPYFLYAAPADSEIARLNGKGGAA